ncbi:PREDICTED: RING finger protein nhl-1-like [Amphimedon queenslandica]|uniref:Uncharacterized protein n=1 Tax=Amphimedon queenslandica TaxID=400682 RepID=A0AAN0J0Z9_AMPQE|nr:PREDICTED: RING finger protein nhl-1-like [Amphimedon queenslandica]|eukprot:XP_019850714.1 PREDICTED: RING finger protein nhl-1-like [Amphimedon queenslandica]
MVVGVPASKMATGPEPLDMLEQLKDQVHCVVCLDVFTEPKTLPCLHSFCTSCLERMPQEKKGYVYALNCPVCRTPASVPTEGVRGYPIAFHINNLIDVYQKLSKVKQRQTLCENCSERNATGHCNECNQFLCTACIDMHKKWAMFSHHVIKSVEEMATSSVGSMITAKKSEKFEAESCKKHGKPLEIYCEKCEEVICSNCTVKIHKDHEYDLISDTYPKHQAIIEASLKPVDKEIRRATNVFAELEKRKKKVKEKGESVKREIRGMVEHIIGILQESEASLTERVDKITQGEEEELIEKSKSVDMALGHMKSCHDFVTQLLSIGNPQQVLVSKKQMMDRMSSVLEMVDLQSFQVKEEFDIQFNADSNIETTAGFLGDVTVVLPQASTPDYGRGQFTCGSIEMKESNVTIPLVIKGAFSHLDDVSISCSLVPEGEKKNKGIKTTIKGESGNYSLSCVPNSNGRHNLTVFANETKIGTKSIVIPFNPYLKVISPVSFLQKLDSPYGVSISPSGTIAVVECSSNSVSILNTKGQKICSIGGRETDRGGQTKFNYPRGVAITHDNHVLVSDNHRLQKVTLEGKVVETIGHPGSGDLEFNTPCGVKINEENGKVYIVESSNHRVQVLNQDLTFSHKFGTQGTGPGQFTRPRDIAFDKAGNIYITDAGNHRIQKFSASGKFVCHIGSPGNGQGQLGRPHGIAVDAYNMVHVAEVANHRVSSFTSDGEFIRCFGDEGSGRDQFKGAGGMTMGTDGRLYICDFYNKRVAVY